MIMFPLELRTMYPAAFEPVGVVVLQRMLFWRESKPSQLSLALTRMLPTTCRASDGATLSARPMPTFRVLRSKNTMPWYQFQSPVVPRISSCSISGLPPVSVARPQKRNGVLFSITKLLLLRMSVLTDWPPAVVTAEPPMPMYMSVLPDSSSHWTPLKAWLPVAWSRMMPSWLRTVDFTSRGLPGLTPMPN